MGLTKTLLLGFIAGATILLGLPIGRLRRPAPSLRALLNAVAVGILLFLVWDVLSAAWEPIDQALGNFHAGHGDLAGALGYGLLATVGLAGGLLGLVGYEEWMRRTAQRVSTRPPTRHGPGAMAAGELRARPGGMGARLALWSAPRRLALLIAVGIGLHNFAEGLAIGQSAASGDIALATLLVVGFGLHNATEGFGIVAPLAADRSESDQAVRPSWLFLLTLGLIGGGPTFVGTAVGHAYTSERVAVVFLTLAAGSIIYVITQLIAIAAKTRRTDLLCYGLLLGLLAGFVTDGIVTAAGV
jgi:ZIP family zinc transporter